jgi:hypothetical protein
MRQYILTVPDGLGEMFIVPPGCDISPVPSAPVGDSEIDRRARLAQMHHAELKLQQLMADSKLVRLTLFGQQFELRATGAEAVRLFLEFDKRDTENRRINKMQMAIKTITDARDAWDMPSIEIEG